MGKYRLPLAIGLTTVVCLAGGFVGGAFFASKSSNWQAEKQKCEIAVKLFEAVEEVQFAKEALDDEVQQCRQKLRTDAPLLRTEAGLLFWEALRTRKTTQDFLADNGVGQLLLEAAVQEASITLGAAGIYIESLKKYPPTKVIEKRVPVYVPTEPKIKGPMEEFEERQREREQKEMQRQIEEIHRYITKLKWLQ